jgi:hypothetical protein
MRGTENLNRMRAEIKTVVNTVASMINVDTEPEVQENVYVYWTIERACGVTRICCYESEELLDSERLLYRNIGDKEVSLHDVAMVHRNLEGFLEWAFSLFPGLMPQMRTIFEAAEL